MKKAERKALYFAPETIRVIEAAKLVNAAGGAAARTVGNGRGNTCSCPSADE